MRAVLEFMWLKQKEDLNDVFEADYDDLKKGTGYTERQLRKSCNRLRRAGLLTRVTVSALARGRPRIVWRLPQKYGELGYIKEVLNAKGDRLKPLIISHIRRTYNPYDFHELCRVFNVSARTMFRQIAKAKKEGTLTTKKGKRWYDGKWKRVTLYYLKSVTKDHALDKWLKD